MRMIRIASVVTILACVPIAIAQQPANSPSSNSRQSDSPASVPGPIIGGDGTTNYIPIWAKPNYLLSSIIYQSNAGNVGAGTTTPEAKIDVNGSANVATMYQIGGTTVLSTPGVANTFVGQGAGFQSTSGDENTFTGASAGASNALGFGNTFTGGSAGERTNQGSENTFDGVEAGADNVDGYSNVFVGVSAGIRSNGSANTFVGPNAGALNVTGDQNTFLGNFAGYYDMSGSNDIYIGSFGATSQTESNAIRIGGDTGLGPQTAAYIAGIYSSTSSSGIPVYINSNGQLGTQTSSQRFKEQIRDMGDSTSALMKLRPVTFVYKPEYAKDEQTLRYGLIAEEVAKVYPELVAYDQDAQPYSVRYQYLSTMLLNEMQKQYRRAESEAEVVKMQERKISNLEQRLSRLEKLVGSQDQTLAQR